MERNAGVLLSQIPEGISNKKVVGGVFAIYELLPAFLFSTVVIIVVSLITKKPSAEIYADFDAVKHNRIEEEAVEEETAAAPVAVAMAMTQTVTVAVVTKKPAQPAVAAESDAPEASEASVAEQEESAVEAPAPKAPVKLQGHTYYSYRSYFCFRKKKEDDEKPF